MKTRRKIQLTVIIVAALVICVILTIQAANG